ncbi:MAG: ATP-binding protein, partial [Anaerolineae bacterium]|nr:ATP-binding protein [Anaerolineae bacterium]
RPGFHFEPLQATDVVKLLLEQFLQRAPGPAHRAALEACALVRVATEGLLAELLTLTDAHDLFEWL